jgi:large subunit ribosomal protein L18
MFTLNKNRRKKIQMRVRAKITGTGSRPRLCVFKSNKHVYAQLIDDDKGLTLSAASSLSAGLKDQIKGKTPSEIATIVGKEIARISLEAGHSSVVFDRNGYRYHGIVKSLADGAREAGLAF